MNYVHQISRSVITATLIAAVLPGCGGREVVEPNAKQTAHRDLTEPPEDASPTTLDAALAKVCDLESESYHIFLREASQLVPPFCVDQSWSTITGVIDKQEFPVIEAWENGDAIHRYYLAKKHAYSFPNGNALDLYLLLSANNLDRPKQPVRRARVYVADVALVAELNAPYADIVAQDGYSKGSILDVMLNSPTVKAEGSRWPILSRIYVHYGIIADRWVEYEASGFQVTVEFTASLNEKIGGKRAYFYIPSGLDPLRSWDGEELMEGFTPADTLGEIQEGGSNEWWSGTHDP